MVIGGLLGPPTLLEGFGTKLSKISQVLLDEALEHKAGASRSNHVAGVVFKGRLVCVGRNSYKSHPYQRRFGRNSESIFLHAEVEASIKALRLLSEGQLRKSSLVVARRHRSGALANSRPCVGCQRLIADLGYKRLHFTTEEGWRHELSGD